MDNPIKTKAAQRVLQLMDSFVDGDGRYCEFVKLVAKEEGMTTEQLDKELEPWI